MNINLFFYYNNKNLEISKKIINIIKKFNYNFNLYNLNNFKILDNFILNSNIVIVIGGDGTIMHIAKICAKYDKLILGVNSGNLGFLATLDQNNIQKLIDILDKKYTISTRILLEAEIPGLLEQNKNILFFNDIVISRGFKSQIINYELNKNSNTICEYSADGIIVSSPSGSTAYSLSAGGPIVEPEMKCMIVTPICAHCLTARTLILNSNEEIVINYKLKENSEVHISIDGNICYSNLKNSYVIVKQSELFVRFVNLNNNFYNNIDKKLINKKI